MKIMFMGTPDFALFSLRALTDAGENVAAVVTQPDKPRGRGYTLTPTPVKAYALERGIPVYQPLTLRDESFAALLDEIKPQLIIVAAYGRLLPENVIKYPEMGCINVHGSCLPRYRGAAPMQRAIIDGCESTGITIMDMDVGLDTGDMILRREVGIGADDNFEVLHDRLGKVGAELLLEALGMIKNGTAVRTRQNESEATYAAKITKQDCIIDFTRSARSVHDLVRGLSPAPLAVTRTVGGKLLKLVSTSVSELDDGGAPGTVRLVGDGVYVVCGDGKCLKINIILPEGRAKMDASAFVRGRGMSDGDVLKWQ